MILTHLVLFSFLGGASVGAAPEPEPEAQVSYSGGWGRPSKRLSPDRGVRGQASNAGIGDWPAEETDTAREARIKAERVRLGIIEPDAPKPAAVEAAGEAIAGGAATLGTPPAPAPACFKPGSVFDGSAEETALAEELARLHTSAYLDEEIKRHFRLQDLDDEEAMFVILAVAQTLH